MQAYWRTIGGILAGLVLIGLLLPSSARVEREAEIGAYPATVFSLLNDFRQVARWSPITTGDPNARVVFTGPQTGAGATIAWTGQIIGRGRETITESVPFERVSVEIDLGDGRKTSRIVRLAGFDGGTKVSWTWQRDYGLNIPGRYFALYLENIRDPEVERKLAALKAMAEDLPQADFSGLDVEHIVVEAQDIAYLTTTSEPESAAVSAAMSDSFFEILGFIDDYGLAEAGAPISIARSFSGGNLVFDAAIPVRGSRDLDPPTAGGVSVGRTYGGPVLRARHVGSYASLGATHEKIAAYLAAKGIERNGDAWESYVSDPDRTDESGLITYIYYPIRNSGS